MKKSIKIIIISSSAILIIGGGIAVFAFTKKNSPINRSFASNYEELCERYNSGEMKMGTDRISDREMPVEFQAQILARTQIIEDVCADGIITDSEESQLEGIMGGMGGALVASVTLLKDLVIFNKLINK